LAVAKPEPASARQRCPACNRLNLAPELTVNHYGEGPDTGCGREAEIDELAGGWAIRNATVGRRCGLGHNSRLRQLHDSGTMTLGRVPKPHPRAAAVSFH
jgi:hypothetical protein